MTSNNGQWTRDDLPDQPSLSEAAIALAVAEDHAARWRRAHGIVQQERDQARATVARLCERLSERAGRAEDAERERDEWKARAEQAEARTAPAVTREDVEKALSLYLPNGSDMHATITETVCALFDAVADPVEAKARELARAGGIDFDEQEPDAVDWLMGMARYVLAEGGDDQ